MSADDKPYKCKTLMALAVVVEGESGYWLAVPRNQKLGASWDKTVCTWLYRHHAIVRGGHPELEGKVAWFRHDASCTSEVFSFARFGVCTLYAMDDPMNDAFTHKVLWALRDEDDELMKKLYGEFLVREAEGLANGIAEVCPAGKKARKEKVAPSAPLTKPLAVPMLMLCSNRWYLTTETLNTSTPAEVKCKPLSVVTGLTSNCLLLALGPQCHEERIKVDEATVRTLRLPTKEHSIPSLEGDGTVALFTTASLQPTDRTDRKQAKAKAQPTSDAVDMDEMPLSLRAAMLTNKPRQDNQPAEPTPAPRAESRDARVKAAVPSKKEQVHTKSKAGENNPLFRVGIKTWCNEPPTADMPTAAAMKVSHSAASSVFGDNSVVTAVMPDGSVASAYTTALREAAANTKEKSKKNAPPDTPMSDVDRVFLDLLACIPLAQEQTRELKAEP